MEIELKLALPFTDPKRLLALLGRAPPLVRRKAHTTSLRNIYFDTPEQALRRQRVALRLRRVDGDGTPKWLQTLKTSGPADSALSQRGEWELAVDGPALSALALQGTPWPDIDPQGRLWPALAPCFETNFERTCWLVRRRDGSAVEVAWDHGRIVAADRATALCELELELHAGPPSALFELARQLARCVPVLPLSASKAERGFALARTGPTEPRRARPPVLAPALDVPQAAQQVLREAFAQFLANLHGLVQSDDPEIVHQARVGWRRFKSLWRLFRPALAPLAAPDWQPLEGLLSGLGLLRDLDVARGQTLPPLRDAFTAGQARRERAWQTMLRGLARAAVLQRSQVLAALSQVPVGECLLVTTQWIENLGESGGSAGVTLKPWVRQRMRRLHRRMRAAQSDVVVPAEQHRVRILAKRLRYSVEALQALLPKRRALAWLRQAADLQGDLGLRRDRAQAARLVTELGAAAELTAFLRGVAAMAN